MKRFAIFILLLFAVEKTSAQDSINYAGTYVNQFVHGYEKIKIYPSGKCRYRIDNGNRGSHNKSGGWSRINDTLIEVVICGWNEEEICSTIPFRIIGELVLERLLPNSEYGFRFQRTESFDANGNVRYTCSSNRSKNQVTWTMKYANGQIKTERNYFKGKLHGEQLEFKKNGTLISRKIYRRGKLKK